MAIVYAGESDAYREARTALLEAEMELRTKTEEVAALRRTLPLGRVVDAYVFDGVDGPVAIADLFGDHDTLILYSYMMGPDATAPCPMCTAFADGADGVAPHIAQRAAFAMVARAPIERFAALARGRGWQNLRLLSAANNSYASDYHSETPDGGQLPLCNVFVRRNGAIHHYWASELFFAPSDTHPRHVDALWPLWSFFDLTPEGRGDFMPALKY